MGLIAKAAVASLLLLCALIVIVKIETHSYDVTVRELAKVIMAPSSCQTTSLMAINFMEEEDINSYFGTMSKLTIPGLGEFTGKDRIKEVIKIRNSDYFDTFGSASRALVIKDQFFEFLAESTEDECVVAAGTLIDLKLGDNFKGQSTIETSINAKIKFKTSNGNLEINEMKVDLPDDLKTAVAGKIDKKKASKNVCNTLKKKCRDIWKKNGFKMKKGMGKCKRAFKKLPAGENGETDGNTQACRIFRAAIVETSSSVVACSHLSLKKKVQIPGEDTGCQDENVKKSKDIFGIEEIDHFTSFKKKTFGSGSGFTIIDV